MHTFLLCSGVHGQPQSLALMGQVVESRRPDGILFAGGVLASSAAPWRMTREDSLFVEEFFRQIGHPGVFSAIIPGECDTPLDEFLRLGMNAEVEFPSVHIAQATTFTRDGLAVTGLGGPVCEGNACELDYCSRTFAQYLLRTLPSAAQPHKVLLLARPARAPSDAPTASVFADELIDSLHPSLCVVGGDGDARVWRVAHTLVVRPGSLSRGRMAWLDWRRSPEEQVELLNAGYTIRSTIRC